MFGRAAMVVVGKQNCVCVGAAIAVQHHYATCGTGACTGAGGAAAAGADAPLDALLAEPQLSLAMPMRAASGEAMLDSKLAHTLPSAL